MSVFPLKKIFTEAYVSVLIVSTIYSKSCNPFVHLQKKNIQKSPEVSVKKNILVLPNIQWLQQSKEPHNYIQNKAQMNQLSKFWCINTTRKYSLKIFQHQHQCINNNQNLNCGDCHIQFNTTICTIVIYNTIT